MIPKILINLSVKILYVPVVDIGTVLDKWHLCLRKLTVMMA